MPQQTHIKTNTHKILLAIIFILVLGFGFGRGEKVEAAYCVCFGEEAGSTGLVLPGNNHTECGNDCVQAGYLTGEETETPGNYSLDSDIDGLLQSIPIVGKSSDDTKSCSFTSHPIDCTLLTLLEFFVWLTTLASTLFIWIMQPENISSILSSKAIYEGWALVRDALNVSFIMFLLFSAFATVFQIDKYNYKNTLLWIVLMALLVNFSFPISRFIIDVSNMMMYYFATTLNIGSDKIDAFTNFASVSNLPGIMHPAVGKDTSSLLAAVIFVFIFMVTMLTISILFVVRTLALAVLIIFSSLAFVGTAVPPLAKHSGDWWKKLFDYSFFGPIMLFMMYIASSLMNEIQRNGMKNMVTIATKDTKFPEYIASLGFFSLPIIILWIGLGIAKEMSGSAGSAVVGKAQGFMKGAGKWTATAPWRAAKTIANQTGIPGGIKQRWARQVKTGEYFGTDAKERREAFFTGKDARIEAERKKTNEIRKEWKDQGVSDTIIDTKLKTGTASEKKAAALEMAEKKGFNDLNQFREAAKALESDPALKKIFDEKVKEKHIKFVIEEEIANIPKTGKTKNKIFEDTLGKMNAEQLSKQKNLHENIGADPDLKNYVTTEIVPDTEFHKELFKKMTKEQRNAYSSVGLTPP